MDLVENRELLRKLKTKGCCFLCLKSKNINQTEELHAGQILKCVSIQSLLRYLQIQTDHSFNGESIFGHCLKQDIQVNLCENCGEIISRFPVLFQKLEKIRLEMDYILERIHKCVSQSAIDPELVQNYSKRMTSDLEALSQLAFVDNLRKEVSKKCFKEVNAHRLQVILTRTNKRIKTEDNDCDFSGNGDSKDMNHVKTEYNEETSEINEEDIPGNYLAEDISPPQSPNSTANHLEDLNLIKEPSSASTSQEKERFPSANPCSTMEPFSTTNPKANTGKYYTRNPSTGMYECNKCDKKSKSRNTITDHYRSIHLKIRHKCNICNVSVFTHSSWLTNHKKTCREKLENAAAIEHETKKFQFFCSKCGKRFKDNNNLANHRLRVHKNVGRFPCDLCDKKFKRSDQLRDHRDAVHLGKRLNCGCCSKTFSYKSDLRAHERKCAKKLSLKEEPQEKR